MKKKKKYYPGLLEQIELYKGEITELDYMYIINPFEGLSKNTLDFVHEGMQKLLEELKKEK